MDAVQARGSELGKDGKFNNEAVEKLQVRDPLLTSHRNNKELTTLQLLSLSRQIHHPQIKTYNKPPGASQG